MTANSKPTHYAVWRKRQSGEWMLFGPRSVLSDRRGPVDVRKADGTFEKRRVVWTSKPFTIDGVEYCFGKAAEKRPCHACEGWHHFDEVNAIYGGGTMGTGAFWRKAEKWCSCGGYLSKEV